MSLPIRLLPEARAEFADAADWYDRQRPGIGVDFVARVRGVLDRVAADPQRHGVVHGDVRKAAMPGFPYIVLYREETGEVIVISVFHTSRDPSVWQSRA